jgi:thymidylate synthase (FAD)
MKIVKASFEVRLIGTGAQMLQHIEWAGRTCYKSEDNITEESAASFISKMAIGRKHESMLEHCSATVHIICDLGVSQEETRHRLVHVEDDWIVDLEWNPAVSQESTRFCNYSKNKFGNEISVVDIRDHFKNPKSLEVWLEACIQAEKNYLRLIELGETPQFARSVLLRSTKTEMTLTSNLRAWRSWFKLRAVGEAGTPHPQMLEISIPLLVEFKRQIPVVFDDIIVAGKDKI